MTNRDLIIFAEMVLDTVSQLLAKAQNNLAEMQRNVEGLMSGQRRVQKMLRRNG